MTAFATAPRPENPGKVENGSEPSRLKEYSPLSPLLGPEVGEVRPGRMAASLETARAYRRPPPTVASPKRRARVKLTPSPNPMQQPPPVRASVPWRARHGGGLAVPEEWLGGIERLATMLSPARIEPQRWAAYVATATRLLHDQGPALHGAEWGTLALFGLHRHCPATYPPGWGLAWLLDTDGDVLDVTPDGVGMRRTPSGARLVFRRRPRTAGVVPVWELC